MRRDNLRSTIVAAVLLVTCLLLSACSGKVGGALSSEQLKDLRKISWEGTELTVTVGTNKSTGCEWKTKFEDDSIIDYSIHRVFHLSDSGAMNGETIGSSDIGYEGKSAGTTHIYLSTPVDWEGNEPGYTYIVTVTVNEDGTIADATGE